MIEEIQQLYPKVKNKTKFIANLSKKVPTGPTTIKQSWLCNSGFWSIPEQYQKLVLDELKLTLKQSR